MSDLPRLRNFRSCATGEVNKLGKSDTIAHYAEVSGGVPDLPNSTNL